MGSSRTLKGFAFLIGGLATTASAMWFVVDQATNNTPHAVALLAGLTFASALLLTLAVRTLRARPGPPAVGAPDYRHVTPLFGAVVLVVLLAGVAIELSILASYGKYGSYRGDAAPSARVREPRHKGEAACATCHEDKARLHDKDAHAAVACETCHGPGMKHVAFRTAQSDAAPGSSDAVPDDAKMRVKNTREWCMTCHRKEPARPGAFPQIDAVEHFKAVGVADASTKCTACHDPHEPLFMDRDLRKARMHPLVHRCRDCHNATMPETAVVPDNHPQTFQCNYCHKDVAERTKKVPHKDLACRTCHIFFKQSEFAGRIIRDTAPEFCLLCHKDTPFRKEGALPKKISWPAHRTEMGDGESDTRKCIDCHRQQIHWPEEGDTK